MKKSLCLSTLFFGLVTSASALEIKPVLPAWFAQKQSDLETIAIAPRWFLEEHTDSLMRDYFGEETAALPLKAVLPPWFAKGVPSRRNSTSPNLRDPSAISGGRTKNLPSPRHRPKNAPN